MYSITTRFREISARAERRDRCPGCGKRVTRSRTFIMTVSPFNKNPDGTVRTPVEVGRAVQAEADSWRPDAELFRHARCA